MSLSADVLSRATPTRLICRGGRWVLELTRLEAVDRDVFQPRLQRLEGPDSILATLRRSEEGQHLASGAAQLMRGARSEEDRAFEATDGDWVPSADVPPAPRHAAPSPRESDLALTVIEMRAELAVLRASHARLRDRVASLEAAQGGVGPTNPRLPRGSRARRRSEPPPGLTEAEPLQASFVENAGFAATQASPGLAAPRPAPPAIEPNPAPAPRTFEEMARALDPEQLPPALTLPKLEALNECLRTLMDQAPIFGSAQRQHELEAFAKPYGCKLLDDDGRERGAIVLDVSAVARLGGALLGSSSEEIEQQLQGSEVGEDALLATSEICNNLTGPLNAVGGNQHVRSTALVSVDVGALPRIRARLDLIVEAGQLALVLF